MFWLRNKENIFRLRSLRWSPVKENHECSKMEANILSADPLDPRDGVNRSKVNFFRYGHVAYQIKGNHEMQQHGSKYFARRPLPTPLTLELGSNFLPADPLFFIELTTEN